MPFELNPRVCWNQYFHEVIVTVMTSKRMQSYFLSHYLNVQTFKILISYVLYIITVSNKTILNITQGFLVLLNRAFIRQRIIT